MKVRKALFLGASLTTLVLIFLNWLKPDWSTRAHVSPQKLLVCPERYVGPSHDSEGEWVTEDCDYAVPMAQLVTIVLTEDNQQMALDVQRALPGVTVILPGKTGKKASTSIKYVQPPKNAKPGEIWNKLISACSTPYTFLAANVLNFSLDLLALQRLVRVLSETEGTDVVGGATVNATGHWRVGCYQVELKNYVLHYRKGYQKSVSDCMRCDFVDGPFLARTQWLKKMAIDKTFPAKMLLPNFFLRIFRSRSSLLCPDVLMDADDLLGSPAAKDRQTWMTLAARWQLNRIKIDFPRSTILHKFSCAEVSMKCEALNIKLTKTLPVCCREGLAKAIDFWAKFANRHGINYQFLSGSLLGAVKMEDILPWDIDGDMLFDRANFTFLETSREAFKKADINLKFIYKPSKGMDFKSWGYIQIWYLGFFLEMYAAPLDNPKANAKIIPDKAAPPGTNPYNTTKVDIHGVWVTTAPNPGLQARGRYGKDILKHAMSWRHTGKKTQADPYDAGHFSATCKGNGHHACLDAMPADGSIYFNVPEY